MHCDAFKPNKEPWIFNQGAAIWLSALQTVVTYPYICHLIYPPSRIIENIVALRLFQLFTLWPLVQTFVIYWLVLGWKVCSSLFSSCQLKVTVHVSCWVESFRTCALTPVCSSAEILLTLMELLTWTSVISWCKQHVGPLKIVQTHNRRTDWPLNQPGHALAPSPQPRFFCLSQPGQFSHPGGAPPWTDTGAVKRAGEEFQLSVQLV